MRSRYLFRLLPVSCVLLAGCSALGSPYRSTYTGERIYLGNHEVVNVGRFDDRSRYACYSGPLVCDSFGVSFDCRCP